MTPVMVGDRLALDAQDVILLGKSFWKIECYYNGKARGQVHPKNSKQKTGRTHRKRFYRKQEENETYYQIYAQYASGKIL